ncbi:16S rRNA (guanine(966)-N(2))-methyltransferase RsmD [Nocardioides sp. CFH 31398]|uniref:16S rRNA (guanine(966)-N(2))-methyltransferase RsmD n=1 Tax=Nocardioides sp. CFH 31398 TaxID=2919579 RepID=UPI001F05EF69|nr:16S rRNA (guanine(966)-N(2))-methyltransferase RsmD [Nocardioides sp. CFH 31398]MCH1868650.1 16S rRNA (guanine(966)-N(2))-methyltransferase RsmD [Nocardioides sp. CFH 31398]
MTRIVGGVAGGRRLRTPSGERTRPTSDRVREALFSALEARLGGFEGLRVLDLYAGSGALGLEAWSRGASALTLVERDRATAGLVRRNAADVGCDVADVVTASVATALGREPAAPYDVVLADPPYPVGEPELTAALAALVDGGWLADDAVLVVERSARSPEPTLPAGLEVERGRTYGETALWYLRAAGPEPADEPGDEGV